MTVRQSIASGLCAFALAASAVVIAPQQATASAEDPAIGTQLALAGASLAQASLLPDLLPVIPGLEANAAMLLGLHEAFVGVPSEGIDGLASLAGSTDLEGDINALSNADTGFDFAFVSEAEAGGVHTVAFTLGASRTVPVPITVMDDDVQILGSNVDIEVAMAPTLITIEYDTAAPTAADGFAFVSLPTFSLTTSLSATPSIPIQFGFAEATASGNFDVNFQVDLELIDPDGLDRVTGTELATASIDDLLQPSFPDNGIDDLDVDLALTADVFGTSFGGQLTITDANLFTDPAPSIAVTPAGTNPIELLTNLGADTAITSLAQLVSSFGATMIAGDVSLPFLADGVFIPADLGVGDLSDFDRVFDVIGPLIDYVTPRSSGQIVCGTAVGPDPDGAGPVEGIPTGALRNLDANQAVYCRAYTSQDGTASWTANGTNVGGAANTIGVEPTTNIALTADGSGDFAVEVEFTPDDGTGAISILPRPDTIQELLTELVDADLIPTTGGGDPLFGYDPTIEAFTLPIGISVAGPINRSATIDAGNSLVAATGLTGLSADGSASASYSLSDISAGITLGLIVTDDVATINPGDNGTGVDAPGPLDRFFLADIDSVLEVGDVEVSADFDMVGRLGFLEVGATVSGALTSPGADSAVTIGIDPTEVTPSATVVVGGTTVPNAILIRDLLSTDLIELVTANIDLAFAGSATVSAAAAGLSASGGFDIEWDLDNPSPTISNFSTDYTNDLLPFGGDLELTQAGAADPGDATLFTGPATGPGAVNLLAEPGLVGSQLVDSTGNVCNITAVLSATQLNCSNAEPATGVVNPVAFNDGDTYDVKGNTLSKLADILAALDGLVAYLEQAVGDTAFGTQIDLIGVSPADIVRQIGELRRMIDEFRGVQDAYIDCIVPADPTADIRAIPLDTTPPGPPPNVTVQCAAESFGSAPTAVQWRIVPGGAVEPGPFVIDGDNDSVSGTANPALAFQALTVGEALDTNGDGFVAIGSEYSVEVEWTDATGDHQAAFPPRVPQSLQQLEQLINDTLGLPDGLVAFELADTPSDPTLRININYGICSAADFIPECANLPTGPRPSADLNFDLSGAGLPDLVGLDIVGSIDVDYAALGQFDVGIPLTGASPVLYGTTGLEARLQVSGSDDLAVEASIGPVAALIGASATGGTGAAEADSTTTLTAIGAFPATKVSTGMVITQTATGDACVISARTDDDNVECALDWTTGDDFELGGRNDLNAGIAAEIQLTDTSAGGAVVADTDSVSFADAGVDVPDLAEVLSGGTCGPIIEGEMTQVVGGAVGAAERDLTGLACAQLSLAADLGGITYLGELDVELIAGANPLRAWVPSDLATRLGDAALNPAFLLRLLPDLLAAIEDGMRSAADSGLPSAIGDPLRTGADGIAVTRAAVEAYLIPFADALAGLALGGALEGRIASEIETLLALPAGTVTVVAECDDGGGGTETCTAAHGLLDVEDISATFTFGDMVESTTGVNLGLEGLPLNVEGGVRAFASWGVTIGLGVNLTEGPYVALDGANPEFLVSAGVALAPGATGCAGPLAGLDYTNDRCLTARLGFLGVEAIDHASVPTIVGAHLGLDIAGSAPDKLTLGDIASGDISLTPQVAAGINIDLHLRTGIADATTDLPAIIGTFALKWDIGTFDEDPALSTFVDLGSVTIDTPSVSFDNLHLDLGELLDDFLVPITKEIKKITGPLQPIVDVISAPIPVVSDLAELVGSAPITMISILEAASGADLALIKALAAFITFVNSIPDGDGLQPIPLGALVGGARAAGSFSVDAAKAGTSVSPSEAGSLIKQDATFKGGKGFTNDVGNATSPGKPNLNSAVSPDPSRPSTFGVPGLSFPFLEDASQVFGMLVGRDATLIRWDAGTLTASAGISYDFGPIMVGPIPITITIGGEIGIEGRFAIGYDTSGIRKLLDGGSGTALFDGIFIDDLDANGNDVPEIKFFGRVFAGAAVDLVIVSAGVRGGIELTFTLDLDDRPDPDGKLRIEEIVDKLANPICLFEVGGKIEAFLEAFVKIDLFFYSKEFSFELVRITLLEWSTACEPPSPEPASQSGNVLYLNIGSRADQRNVQETKTDESIEVRQLGAGKVRVTAFGFEKVYTGVGLIVADGGEDDDEIIFLPGASDEAVGGAIDPTPIPFTIPSVVSGGPGNDIIKTGDGADLILGDTAVGAGTWETVGYDAIDFEAGPDGNDVINAGGGNDVVKSGGGNDRVEGEFGRDTIEGGPGDDQLNGGPGGDAVLGEGGVDSVNGGPIKQPAPGATAAQIDDNDALSGGVDSDTVAGGFGDDVMFGDDPVAGFMDPDSAMRRLGYSTPSPATWRSWCDAPAGAGAADIVVGNAGDDVMVGGAGGDQMDGEEGDDSICGGAGEDQILGNDGDDELRGNADNDVLDGNDDDDAIFGGGGNDIANGNDGDDDIFGDAGSDLLNGNDGNDIIVGDSGDVAPDHQHGVTTDGLTISTARVLALDIAVTRSSSTAGPIRVDCELANAVGDSDCVFGGSGSDALFGGSDGDIIQGQSGVDLIEGNHGPDNIRGGTGQDLLFGNEHSDTMFGDGADDDMFGDRSIPMWNTNTAQGAAIDLMYGGPGADHMEGDGADDDMFGGAGNDHMEGNNGADAMFGESGDDDMIGGSDQAGEPDTGESIMVGDIGSDVMTGDNAIIGATGYVGGRSVTLLDPTIGGADTMNGNAAVDFMFGQFANDTMSGGDAGDYMEGNDGNDVMHGNEGDDDMIGGSSQEAGSPIEATRDGSGMADSGETVMTGDAGRDWMAGDNARLDRVLNGLSGNAALTAHPITLFDLATDGGAAVPASAHGPDVMIGDTSSDLMFGQGSNDTMSGGDAGDYMEGNDGNDDMAGNDGDDDMIGGGSANDGVIIADRNGTGLDDSGETSMLGGTGDDWMAGDNARMNRVLQGLSGASALTAQPIQLFDLAVVGGQVVPSSAHGPDVMGGGDDVDFMFGQGSNDTMSGGDAGDYMEGNDGNDDMAGNDGDDDMIGGGSAKNGSILPVRDGEGLHDAGETLMTGGIGVDWMAGDNAFMNRVLFSDAVTPIDLFDVNSADEAVVSGGDTMQGNEGDDLIFGQGNGAQVGQSDPFDTVDNDGDGLVDEDAAWLGDTISGGPDDDYVEGNQGADLITGDGGADDLIGGGSALDGLFIHDRIGNGLQDGRDTIYGDVGEDVITGDNARINHRSPVTGLLLTNDREILLFDVDSTDAALSGGDFLSGGAERDLMFGQGNGAQSPDQADPLDGVDNDFDGREGPDSTEYDCADNGFDNDGDGLADAADPDCSGSGVVDEDQPWDGDIMRGDGGDDYMEGNAGADWMFGGDDEDDMIGGGSAIDGAIVPDRDPAGLLDGSDVMHGDADDDVMTGDNARINRVDTGGAWARLSSAGVASEPGFGPYDQVVRITDMFPGDAGTEAHDDDYMTGGLGNDEMYGQLGDDFVLGNAGDDALIGDLGQVRANLLGDGVGVDPARRMISTNSPHWEDTINEVGSMLWETELYAFDTSVDGVGGNDVLLGHDGRDTAFGGPGDDVINGDGDGTEEVPDPVQPEFTQITDVDPATVDQDMLFGGDGGDAIWGGRDNDIVMGGHGDDFLDVRPREETDNGRNGANFRIIPRDPASWFTWAFPENFQGVDFIYGGWDRDALQADQAANGPDAGDRLADWAGGFNVFYLCPAGYGDHTITRMGAPHARNFLRDLTEASGAFMTSTDGASGFRDLGYVFPNQRGANSHPPHPDHPGHFTCADYAGVGSGVAAGEAGGPYEVAEGGTTALDGSGSTGTGGIASYLWDAGPFGIDDASSATPNIDAAGLDDGAAVVHLEITDAEGSFAVDSADVTIVNAVPAVTIDALATMVAEGEPVALTATYADPGVLDTHTVVIDWGDGTTCDPDIGPDCSRVAAGSTGSISGSHTYPTANVFDLVVTVTDDDLGVGTSLPSSVTVGPAAPTGVQTAAVWVTLDPWPLADPIAVGGASYTRVEAIDVFDDGNNNEQSSYLFREFVAALLNQAAGGDTTCIATTLADAETWLLAHPPGSGVKKNKSVWKNDGKALFDTLTAYNDGALCAPSA